MALTFQQIIGKSVLLLPVGACDDGAHSQSEKIDRYSNFLLNCSFDLMLNIKNFVSKSISE